MPWKSNRLAWASAAVLVSTGLAPAAMATPAPGVCSHYVDDYKPDAVTPPDPAEVPVDPNILDGAAGFYQMGAHNVVTLAREGMHLTVQLMGQPVMRVYPENPTTFYYRGFEKGARPTITLVTDASGQTNALILHRDHQQDIGRIRRIDAARADKLKAALAPRLDPDTGDPLSMAALRHLIEGIRAGAPDYKKMSPELAIAARRQEHTAKAFQDALGEVKSIQFLGVVDEGIRGVRSDTYDVWHANGVVRWVLAVDDKGIIAGAGFGCGP